MLCYLEEKIPITIGYWKIAKNCYIIDVKKVLVT
jgi:hypothetical protein